MASNRTVYHVVPDAIGRSPRDGEGNRPIQTLGPRSQGGSVSVWGGT
jgi:hypothetical protein